MPKYSVVVSLRDKQWHSIRSTKESALFRVSEHMMDDTDPVVVTIGQKLNWKILFNNPYEQMLKEDGFTVEIKELE